MKNMQKYGMSGMEPRPVFTEKVLTLIDNLTARVEELEAKLAEKPKAAAKKTVSE